MEFLDELRSLKDQIRFNGRFEIPEGTKNVVIAGMGGSGIVGRIFSELYSEIPVSIVDDYRAPDFVGKETLYIAISYSGNTEETIDSVNDAKAKGAITLAITSGGKLAKLADKTVIIPKGLNPRSALGYMLAPLATSFGIAGDKEIDEAYKLLNELDENNEAEKGIAREIYSNESIPVIYGIAPYKAVAYRWKTQFSENAKVLAYSSSFPELNHNDTMSLDGTYRKGEFYFIAFTDGENPKVEEFRPLDDEKVRIYVCGITPYDTTHLGHAFTYIFFDALVRYLIAFGECFSSKSDTRTRLPSDFDIFSPMYMTMAVCMKCLTNGFLPVKLSDCAISLS